MKPKSTAAAPTPPRDSRRRGVFRWVLASVAIVIVVALGYKLLPTTEPPPPGRELTELTIYFADPIDLTGMPEIAAALNDYKGAVELRTQQYAIAIHDLFVEWPNIEQLDGAVLRLTYHSPAQYTNAEMLLDSKGQILQRSSWRTDHPLFPWITKKQHIPQVIVKSTEPDTQPSGDDASGIFQVVISTGSDSSGTQDQIIVQVTQRHHTDPTLCRKSIPRADLLAESDGVTKLKNFDMIIDFIAACTVREAIGSHNGSEDNEDFVQDLMRETVSTFHTHMFAGLEQYSRFKASLSRENQDHEALLKAIMSFAHAAKTKGEGTSNRRLAQYLLVHAATTFRGFGHEFSSKEESFNTFRQVLDDTFLHDPFNTPKSRWTHALALDSAGRHHEAGEIWESIATSPSSSNEGGKTLTALTALNRQHSSSRAEGRLGEALNGHRELLSSQSDAAKGSDSSQRDAQVNVNYWLNLTPSPLEASTDRAIANAAIHREVAQDYLEVWAVLQSLHSGLRTPVNILGSYDTLKSKVASSGDLPEEFQLDFADLDDERQQCSDDDEGACTVLRTTAAIRLREGMKKALDGAFQELETSSTRLLHIYSDLCGSTGSTCSLTVIPSTGTSETEKSVSYLPKQTPSPMASSEARLLAGSQRETISQIENEIFDIFELEAMLRCPQLRQALSLVPAGSSEPQQGQSTAEIDIRSLVKNPRFSSRAKAAIEACVLSTEPDSPLLTVEEFLQDTVATPAYLRRLEDYATRVFFLSSKWDQELTPMTQFLVRYSHLTSISDKYDVIASFTSEMELRKEILKRLSRGEQSQDFFDELWERELSPTFQEWLEVVDDAVDSERFPGVSKRTFDDNMASKIAIAKAELQKWLTFVDGTDRQPRHHAKQLAWRIYMARKNIEADTVGRVAQLMLKHGIPAPLEPGSLPETVLRLFDIVAAKRLAQRSLFRDMIPEEGRLSPDCSSVSFHDLGYSGSEGDAVVFLAPRRHSDPAGRRVKVDSMYQAEQVLRHSETSSDTVACRPYEGAPRHDTQHCINSFLQAVKERRGDYVLSNASDRMRVSSVDFSRVFSTWLTDKPAIGNADTLLCWLAADDDRRRELSGEISPTLR